MPLKKSPEVLDIFQCCSSRRNVLTFFLFLTETKKFVTEGRPAIYECDKVQTLDYASLCLFTKLVAALFHRQY